MIRIALISDIHFGKEGRGDFTLPSSQDFGVGNIEKNMSEKLCEKLIELRPEYLLIAGDLTSIGSPDEYYYCEKKILDIAKKVGIEKKKIIWCTGNHDNDWQISKLCGIEKEDDIGKENGGKEDNSAKNKVIIEKYSEIASSVSEKYITELPKPEETGECPASGIYQDNNMIVYILNSATNCLHYSTSSHGEITEKQREWLKRKLEESKDEKKWKIVLLHHHPFNYPYPIVGRDVSFLSDGSEFEEIIGGGGVNLVIHGHRHHPRCKTKEETGWKNPIAYVCAGSLAIKEHGRLSGEIPNMFHIIDLEEKVGQLFLYSYQYASGNGWFAAERKGGTIPLDAKMRLGRIVSTEVIEEKINQIINEFRESREKTLSLDWDELDEDLQFNLCSEINEKIISLVNDEFIVKANLPLNLTLKRKDGTI